MPKRKVSPAEKKLLAGPRVCSEQAPGVAMDVTMRLITQALGTAAASSFCRCLLQTSLFPHRAPSVTFPLRSCPPLSINSWLKWFPPLVSSCQGECPSPSQEFPLGKLQVVLRVEGKQLEESPRSGKSKRRWKESEEPGGVRSIPRAMPSASDAGGRPGEGKPCFPTPALLRRGPVCTHSGVGVNHRPRGREGQCAAWGKRRGRGLVPSTPTLAKVRGHQPLTAIPSTMPRLDREGTGVILVSFLPLVGCVPFCAGTSRVTRGVTQLLRVGLRLVIGLVKEGQIFFNPSQREPVCEN